MSRGDIAHLLPVLAFTALVAFLVMLFIGSGNASATCIKPPGGDWNIVSGETCTFNGDFLPVSGDIHVQSGGTLNLNGASVRVDSTYDGQFMIEVQTGGTLKAMSGTTITAGDTRYEYKFLVRSGSTLQITDSTIKEVGFGSANDEDMGLRIETESATISRSTFADSYVALYMKQVSPIVDNSTFEHNFLALLCQGPSTMGFYDNTVRYNSKGVYFTDAKPDIVKNVFLSNSEEGVYLLRTDGRIYNNRFTQNAYGVAAVHSSPSITHNNMSSNWDGVRIFFGAPLIEHNELWMNNRSGLYLVGTGGHISANTIDGDPTGVKVTVFGIFLQQSTAAVTNNTIKNITIYGMWIDGDSDVALMDNLVMYAGTGMNIIHCHVKMLNNKFIENYYGISVSTVSGRIDGNIFSRNYIGLEVYMSNSSLSIGSNILSNNTKRGISLQDASVIIEGNTFDSNPRSISCNRSVPIITGNTIRNSEYGVEIAGYSVLYFANNTVMNGNYTVYSIKSRSTIYNNTITSSWNYSIYLCRNSYSKIVGNTFTGRAAKGVYIIESDADVYDNDFKEAAVGIYATYANLTLRNNTFHDNDVGLMLNKTKATVDGGDIHDQTQFGMVLSETDLHVSDVRLQNTKDGIFITGSSEWPARVWFDNISITDGRKGLSAISGSYVSITGSKVAHNKETGLYIVDAHLEMSSMLISDNKYGVSAIRSDVRATSSFFSLGEEGISADGSGVVQRPELILDRCTFSDINYTGVKALELRIRVKASLFTRNGNGMLVENGTLSMVESHFLENTDMGVRVNGTKVTAQDSLFIGNMDGIFDVGSSSLDIFDCNMSSNEVFGLYTDDSTIYSNITISRRIIIQDNSLLVRGFVLMVQDGHLELLRAPLVLYSVESGDAGVHIMTGGSLEVIESLVYSNDFNTDPSADPNSNKGYVFIAEPNSGLTIINSTVRHCGWGLSAPLNGFLIKTQYADIQETLFENNSIGLYIYSTTFNATGLRFKQNGVSLLADLSAVYLVNSSFISVRGKDIVLTHSNVKVLNTKVSFTKVDVQDIGSIFTVMWYLHVSVAWDDGQPIEMADITVTDRSQVKLSTHTDYQGFARWLVVKEYQQLGPETSGYFAFSPLSINASDRGISVTKNEYVSSSMTIKIVLVDKTPPKVTITTPLNGSIAYDINILVIGTAIDDASGEVEVEISVDGLSWIPAQGSTSWSAGLSIPEGNHTILARARDGRGNIGITSIYLEVDLSSPMLEVYSPSDGQLTNTSFINVRGRVHLGSGLIINGDTVPVSVNGAFDKGLMLVEGENIIHIKAIRQNRSVEVNLTVFKDTRPPAIILKHPSSGTFVNSTFVTITVTTDEEATFYIAGQFTQVFGGEADISLELPEGSNKVHVKATDKAGNVNETDLSINVDRTRPVLSLVKPSSPAFKTSKDRLQITGMTEPGAILTIDGKPVPVGAKGNFTVKQKLKMGSNQVTITSMDKAGNTNTLLLSIKRTESVDLVKYLALLGTALLVAIVGNVGIFIYFRNYYGRKGAPVAAEGPDRSKRTVGKAPAVQEPMQRTVPRRPPPGQGVAATQVPPDADGPEFEELEDLGEF